jgi:lipopolysaccharide export system protein LptA
MRHPVLLLALAFAAPLAHALDSDKDKPLDVYSEKFDGGPSAPITKLDGHVKLTQGSLVGTGDHADVHQKDKVITRVVMTGAPATLKQDIEGGGTMDSKAKTIDYDVVAKRAVLTGIAVVVHPRGEARGEHLTYDVDTGKMTGEGGTEPFHLHFVPETAEQKKAKEDEKKAKDAEKKK